MKAFEKTKLIGNSGRMFVWMSFHMTHAAKRMTTVVVDHFSDEHKTTTICRCLWCGRTFQFSSK